MSALRGTHPRCSYMLWTLVAATAAASSGDLEPQSLQPADDLRKQLRRDRRVQCTCHGRTAVFNCCTARLPSRLRSLTHVLFMVFLPGPSSTVVENSQAPPVPVSWPSRAPSPRPDDGGTVRQVPGGFHRGWLVKYSIPKTMNDFE